MAAGQGLVGNGGLPWVSGAPGSSPWSARNQLWGLCGRPATQHLWAQLLGWLRTWVSFLAGSHVISCHHVWEDLQAKLLCSPLGNQGS